MTVTGMCLEQISPAGVELFTSWIDWICLPFHSLPFAAWQPGAVRSEANAAGSPRCAGLQVQELKFCSQEALRLHVFNIKSSGNPASLTNIFLVHVAVLASVCLVYWVMCKIFVRMRMC